MLLVPSCWHIHTLLFTNFSELKPANRLYFYGYCLAWLHNYSYELPIRTFKVAFVFEILSFLATQPSDPVIFDSIYTNPAISLVAFLKRLISDQEGFALIFFLLFLQYWVFQFLQDKLSIKTSFFAHLFYKVYLLASVIGYLYRTIGPLVTIDTCNFFIRTPVPLLLAFLSVIVFLQPVLNYLLAFSPSFFSKLKEVEINFKVFKLFVYFSSILACINCIFYLYRQFRFSQSAQHAFQESIRKYSLIHTFYQNYGRVKHSFYKIDQNMVIACHKMILYAIFNMDDQVFPMIYFKGIFGDREEILKSTYKFYQVLVILSIYSPLRYRYTYYYAFQSQITLETHYLGQSRFFLASISFDKWYLAQLAYF